MIRAVKNKNKKAIHSWIWVFVSHTQLPAFFLILALLLFFKCRSDKDVDHDWLPKAPSLAYDDYSIKDGDDEDSYDDESLETNDDTMTR